MVFARRRRNVRAVRTYGSYFSGASRDTISVGLHLFIIVTKRYRSALVSCVVPPSIASRRWYYNPKENPCLTLMMGSTPPCKTLILATVLTLTLALAAAYAAYAAAAYFLIYLTICLLR